MAEVSTQPATVTGTVVAQPAAGGLTRRMPTSTLGMAGDWSCPPTADRKLDASKKDFTLCGALCCSLCYMDRDSGCWPFCHGHGQLLCLAKDEVCLDFGEKDKSLACICAEINFRTNAP